MAATSTTDIADTTYTSWVDSRTQIEVDRLRLQHDLQQHTVGPLIIPPLPLPPTSSPPSSSSSLQTTRTGCKSSSLSILDLGCGPSHWLLSLAVLYPSLELYGTDITSCMFPPAHVRPPNLYLELHDVFEDFPEDWRGKFDLVNAKNLFLWIGKERWVEVLGRIRGILKPGGWIQIVEYGPWFPDTGIVGKLHSMRNYLLDCVGMSPTYITSLPSYADLAGYTRIQSDPRRYPIGKAHPVEEWRQSSVEAIMPIFRGVKANCIRGQLVDIEGEDTWFPEHDDEYDDMIERARQIMFECGSGILQITIAQAPGTVVS